MASAKKTAWTADNAEEAAEPEQSQCVRVCVCACRLIQPPRSPCRPPLSSSARAEGTLRCSPSKTSTVMFTKTTHHHVPRPRKTTPRPSETTRIPRGNCTGDVTPPLVPLPTARLVASLGRGCPRSTAIPKETGSHLIWSIQVFRIGPFHSTVEPPLFLNGGEGWRKTEMTSSSSPGLACGLLQHLSNDSICTYI